MSTVKTSALFVTLALTGALLSGRSSAQTLLDIPAITGWFEFGNGALADSWTQSASVTDGSISVGVQGADPSGGPINFYLTTAIGSSATLSNLVAFTSIQVPFVTTTVTPFTNLSLGPGTYYLVMADYNSTSQVNGAAWTYWAGDSNIQTAPGFTVGGPIEAASSLSMFAPASNFTQDEYDLRGVLSLTGTVSQTTTHQAPDIDPSTTASAATLLLGALAVLRRNRRRAGGGRGNAELEGSQQAHALSAS